jgi:hypothetical protein
LHIVNLPCRENVLRRLDRVGIFAQSHVTLEHQHLARRYVVPGIESGGAVREMGRYVTFCGPAGESPPYLYPSDAVGVNGIHAVVVAPILGPLELFRTDRTCPLLITRHEPGNVENRWRPPWDNRGLFRGVNGLPDTGPPYKHDGVISSTLPKFWTRDGEALEIPPLFTAAVQAATIGAGCIGCSHIHFLAVPSALMVELGSDR